MDDVEGNTCPRSMDGDDEVSDNDSMETGEVRSPVADPAPAEYEGLMECKKCGVFKPASAFYLDRKKIARNKNHAVAGGQQLFYRSTCKGCWTEDTLRRRTTLNGYLRHIQINAKFRSTQRSREYSLTFDDVVSKWHAQKGLCALTNFPMTHVITDIKDRSNFVNIYNASIDRIDSSLGYVKDNIQLVCAQVNLMKGDLTHEQMAQFCGAISEMYEKRRISN